MLRPSGHEPEKAGSALDYALLGTSISPTEPVKSISSADVIPLPQARSNLSQFADQVKSGAEKIITKNGESYVALIDAERLDHYQRLEQERIHLLLIDDASRSLSDVAAGKLKDALSAVSALKHRQLSFDFPGRWRI